MEVWDRLRSPLFMRALAVTHDRHALAFQGLRGHSPIVNMARSLSSSDSPKELLYLASRRAG